MPAKHKISDSASTPTVSASSITEAIAMQDNDAQLNGEGPPTTVCQPSPAAITVLTAERVLKAYAAIKSADREYQKCQSATFRQYVMDVVTAPNLETAMKELEEYVKASK